MINKIRFTTDNWKFLIRWLVWFIGMIGSFMGTTLGFGPFLIKLINPDGFVALLFFEGLWLVIFAFILLLVIIDYIKDNKRSRQC
jgi:phage shock protein PspC (stress-responsive transcriptional regulator)